MAYRKRRYVRKRTAMPRKKRRTAYAYSRKRMAVARLPNIAPPTRRLLTSFTPLPTNMVNKMRWVRTVAFPAGTADVIANHVLYASAIYDPDYTDSSTPIHQPMGYDQISPIFNRWVVLGSKITVVFSQANPASSNVLMLCGVRGSPGFTPITSTPSTIQEQGQSKWVQLGRDANQKATVVLFYSPQKHIGVQDPRDSDNLEGTISSNPTDNWFFHIWCTNAYPATTPTPIAAEVTIEYTVAWKQPEQLAAS